MHSICFGLFVIVCLVLFETSFSDESLLSLDEAEHEKACDPGTGRLSGQCTPIASCPDALDIISSGGFPMMCSFKGQDPVVCCPKVEKTITNVPPNITLVSVQTNTSEPPLKRTPRKTLPYLKYPGCGTRSLSSRGPILAQFSAAQKRLPAEFKKGPSVEFQMALTIRGEPSVPFSWPWMVAIFSHVFSQRSRFHCGGSLISDQYILTAAHCFQGSRDPRRYYVVIEAHERSRGYVHGIRSIVVHENYSPRAYYDDIALLRLTLPAKFGTNTKPVCLPSPTLARKSIDDREVIVTGWGHISFGGPDSDILREATLKVVPRHRCNATYTAFSKFRFPKGIDSRMLCAGVADGSKDACKGDSGGPLVLNDGVWTQVGIVSFGFRCAEPGFPGVYTKVSEYLDWIDKKTNIPKVDPSPL